LGQLVARFEDALLSTEKRKLMI